MIERIATTHIGLVGPLPPPSGGMANQLLQLRELLANDGINIEIIQTNAPYSPAWVASVKAVRSIFRLVPYLFKLWRVTSRVDLLHVFANSGWSWHLFAAPAVWIAHWRGVPVIVNYHGGEAESFFQKAFSWVKPTLNRATVITVPSGFLLEVFKNWKVESIVVPNIIDLGRFAESEKKQVSSIQQYPTILISRNLEPIYDIATGIKAFKVVKKEFPNAKLLVAGSGPDLVALKKLVSEMELVESVEFVGRIENSEMPSLYRRSNIMLNTSLADNMPISILEALASGVPVVSTNVGGIPYLVQNGKTALLVSAGDYSGMAKAIIDILINEKLQETLVKEGRQCVSVYAWGKIKPILYGVYEKTVFEKAKAKAQG